MRRNDCSHRHLGRDEGEDRPAPAGIGTRLASPNATRTENRGPVTPGHLIPRDMMVMLLAATPAPSPSRTPANRKVTVRASRPALIDLRFKGDAWLVVRGTHMQAAVCLGDFSLGEVA